MALLLTALLATSAMAQTPAPSWTDWADLALAAPVVVEARIERVERMGRRQAPDVPPGAARALVRVALDSALKAPTVLPAAGLVQWQGPAGPRGRLPIARGQPVLMFAQAVPGSTRPDVQIYRLVSPHGLQPATPDAGGTVRAILGEAIAGNPGMVTGITDGFHTAGPVAGHSDSQFFLATDRGRPLTLVVRRRPGNAPAVLLATGDMIGTARPIAPETLAWRAVACGLPGALPPALGADADLVADHALARRSVGACGRRLG